MNKVTLIKEVEDLIQQTTDTNKTESLTNQYVRINEFVKQQRKQLNFIDNSFKLPREQQTRFKYQFKKIKEQPEYIKELYPKLVNSFETTKDLTLKVRYVDLMHYCNFIASRDKINLIQPEWIEQSSKALKKLIIQSKEEKDKKRYEDWVRFISSRGNTAMEEFKSMFYIWNKSQRVDKDGGTGMLLTELFSTFISKCGTAEHQQWLEEVKSENYSVNPYDGMYWDGYKWCKGEKDLVYIPTKVDWDEDAIRQFEKEMGIETVDAF